MIDDLAERVWSEPQFHEDLVWAAWQAFVDSC